MKVLDFGKCEGTELGNCPEKYILWLAQHEKVLAKRNRWASRDAKFLLEKKEEKAMLKGVRQEVSGEFDMLRSIRATAKEASEPFTSKEMYEVLKSVSGSFPVNERRVQSFLTTLCTHMGEFDLIELADGKYTQYSDELYRSLQAK